MSLKQQIKRPQKEVTSKAYLGTICFIAALLLACPHSYAKPERFVTLALIADEAYDLHKSPLVSLLEVKLSQKQEIQLLERARIKKILAEQKLSVAGLLQWDKVVEVGRLLRADAFLLLAIENEGGREKDENKLLRVRVVETGHGLRLLDSFEELDELKPEGSAERITEKVAAIAPKIMLPLGEAVPVGIVDVHRVQLGERYQLLERTLPALLSVRLSKELRIIMLEREDLKILHDEKLLTEGGDMEFWGSAVLVDGYLQPKGTNDVEMKLRLRRASAKEIAEFTVPIEPNEPSAAVDKIVNDIIQKLLNAPPSVSWQPEQEAEEFFRQGQLLRNHKRHKDALTPLETAHALQPTNVYYTGALFVNEWEARSLEKGGFYSDLGLAELVCLLVRQIQIEYEKGLLPKAYVLEEYGRPLGIATDRYGRLSGYFSRPVSVSTDEIRYMNRENRKIWVETNKKAAINWHGLPTRHAVLVHSAWVSSYEPKQIIENLRESLIEFIMPMELGGKERFARNRFKYSRWALLRPPTNILGGRDIRDIENTHLKGAGEKFKELWVQYLEDLTKIDDPVVKFVSYLALVRQYQQENTNKAKRCCETALEILQQKIENLDELSDDNRRWIRNEMCKAIARAAFEPDEKIRIFYKIYDPLIEKKDARNLALWSPGTHYWRWIYYSDIAVAKDSAQLLEQVANILQHSGKQDDDIGMSLNIVRDTLERLRKRFPELSSFEKPAGPIVTMLLRKDDWPKKSSFEYVRVLLDDNMLWLGFAKPGVGLAGINLSDRNLDSLWQADCGNGTTPYHPGKGEEINGPIMGMAISENTCYAAIKDMGIVEFPGSITKGRRSLTSPKMLTEKDGLPSVSITGMTAVGDKLWLAYGGPTQESGLIAYDPESGDFETVFCSTLKADNPFSEGKPYEISSLTLAPDNSLFFIVRGRTENWTKINQITGLWKINIDSKHLKFIWHDQFKRYFLESIEDTGESWWLRDLEFLGRFDPNSETVTFILGDRRVDAQTDPMPELKDGMFVPKSSVAIEFGHLVWGHISLKTAAVHGDRLWARMGESQLIVIHKGKNFEEAEIIDNNILDGDKVLRFFSTPYGLIAIGNGTVGLVETGGNI